QDGKAAIGLHPLQQVADFDIGVAVVAVLDVAALAEQRVGLVEQEDGAAVLGGIEDAPQILLGLAHIFVDHRREVDPVQIEPELGRQYLGGERLSGSAAAAEQRRYAKAARVAPAEAPFLVDADALAHLGGDLAQGGDLPG